MRTTETTPGPSPSHRTAPAAQSNLCELPDAHAILAAPSNARQVRNVRRFTTVQTAHWGLTADESSRAELIVSELAGNAVRHGRSDMQVYCR